MSSETLSFEQATPLNTEELSNTQPEEVTSELDFSQAEPVKAKAVVEDTITEGIDFSQGEEIKVSNLEKLEYAFDKNTQIRLPLISSSKAAYAPLIV